MPNEQSTDPLFEKHGVELEYMIVDAESLMIKPIADQVMHQVADDYANEIELADTLWSNELALHQIEIKIKNPETALQKLPKIFQRDVNKINALLDNFHAKLLPTAMHPLMLPQRETSLWPHDNNEIYDAYNKIFNCSSHGWVNLQSTHLNLPFKNEEEFVKLHTAIRLVLPIIPALCASSPVVEGKINGILDNRLNFYMRNQQKIKSIAGSIVPELILSKQEYQDKILAPMYRDIAPYDPEKILQHEWLNSRGAIARFARDTIEIRLIDCQENPLVEIAILYFVTAFLKAIIGEMWMSFKMQCAFTTENLARLLFVHIQDGSSTLIDDANYLAAFHFDACFPCPAKKFLMHLYNQLHAKKLLPNSKFNSVIAHILENGNLAERIIKRLKMGNATNPCAITNIQSIYNHLAACLAKGEIFA